MVRTILAEATTPPEDARKATPDELIAVVMQYMQRRGAAKTLQDVRLNRLLFIKRLQEVNLYQHIDWSE